MKITAIGSCFSGFIKKPIVERFSNSGFGQVEFLTNTMWQRVDSIVDILSGNVPDYELIKFYIENGFWERKKPLGIEVNHGIKDSKWFATRILEENGKAAKIVNDLPDILLFDSLSDWRHPLYKNRKNPWKCFLGKINFRDRRIQDRFEREFEFIRLLDLEDLNRCINSVEGYFRERNERLMTFYIHFPALTSYLEEKWILRAHDMVEQVSKLKGENKNFYQIVIPEEKVKPITDMFHPNYSVEIWNHFYDEVYEYCADFIISKLRINSENPNYLS